MPPAGKQSFSVIYFYLNFAFPEKRREKMKKTATEMKVALTFDRWIRSFSQAK